MPEKMSIIQIFSSGTKAVQTPSATKLHVFCTHHGLTSNEIDQKVSDEHILEIYVQMVNPILVATHLGLSQADIESIQFKARDSMKMMRLYILLDWKEKGTLDETPTYRVLFKALLNSGNSKTALEVCKLLGHL